VRSHQTVPSSPPPGYCLQQKKSNSPTWRHILVKYRDSMCTVYNTITMTPCTLGVLAKILYKYAIMIKFRSSPLFYAHLLHKLRIYRFANYRYLTTVTCTRSF